MILVLYVIGWNILGDSFVRIKFIFHLSSTSSAILSHRPFCVTYPKHSPRLTVCYRKCFDEPFLSRYPLSLLKLRFEELWGQFLRFLRRNWKWSKETWGDILGFSHSGCWRSYCTTKRNSSTIHHHKLKTTRDTLLIMFIHEKWK